MDMPTGTTGRRFDIGQPRTNRKRTGKRTPEAVRWSKTGHAWAALQRQPIRQRCCDEISAVIITHPLIGFHHEFTTT